MWVLETERLFLREMTTEDAEMLYLLNLDPEVIQYTGDSYFESIASATAFLTAYDHYRKYGIGRWAVIHKTSGEFLGWCGLKYTRALDEYDIGFRFFKQHWNKGYATEAATACIESGFSQYKMPQIVGRVMKQNIASIAVLRKIGLTYAAPFDFNGQEGLIFKIKSNKLVS